MANKRKNKNKNNNKNRKTALLKSEKKPFPKKKALILFVLFIIVFAVYQVMLYFEKVWIMHVYAIGAGALMAVAICITRGMFRVPKRSELSNELSEGEKDELICLITKRRKMSLPFLYLFAAVLLTLLFDTAYLFLTLNLGVKI